MDHISNHVFGLLPKIQEKENPNISELRVILNYLCSRFWAIIKLRMKEYLDINSLLGNHHGTRTCSIGIYLQPECRFFSPVYFFHVAPFQSTFTCGLEGMANLVKSNTAELAEIHDEI